MAKASKGERRKAEITAAAERLFYRQGIADTSFSDLAEASGVPRGNFYFHYKDKQSIVDAVVEVRRRELQRLVDALDERHADPRQRLMGFVENLVDRAEQVSKFGCPVGSMVDEIAKGMLEQVAAASLFDLLKGWMKLQFRALGFSPQRAESTAVELLCRTQGINVLATAYAEPALVRQQCRRIKDWLRGV